MQESTCTTCNRSGAEVDFILSPPGMKPICGNCLNAYGGFFNYLIDMGILCTISQVMN